MNFKNKPVAYWMAWAPLALIAGFLLSGAVLALANAIAEAPVFMLGILFFVVWCAWGYWYLDSRNGS